MRQRAPRFFFWALAAVPVALLTLGANACGQESVTIPDPVLPDTGITADGGNDGNTSGETGVADAGDAADVTCADVLPDDTMGIYVTPTGTNSGTCGTRTSPCKTITASVNRAGAALRTKVYAARGIYTERAVLAAGIEVIGGWDVTGTTWKRACVTPEEAVVIRAPAAQNVTVEARDLGGEARLSMLRIESKVAAQVQAGESLYGVVAVGATTVLTLNDVDIVVGAAGVGSDGTKGTAGTAGAASCPTGTGVAGTAGSTGTGAPAGMFDPMNAYSPGVATGGGANATAGGDGVLAGGAGQCITCGTCGAVLCDFIPNLVQTCGKDGTTGCGGGPGAPGAPALGGGSSVALFAWDASVTINGGKMKSGDGGNGGIGGAGGAGGAGSKGAAGAPADACTTACNLVAAACVETKTKAAGGTAGGNGAAGGIGGAGGGGGGGSSFAIYQGGAGVVTTAGGTALSHGKAGTGGTPAAGMGAAGAAADRVP